MASMEPTQTPEYLAHWETLNNLEQAFSKFHNVREILQSAIDSYSPDETKEDFVRRVVRNINWKSVCKVVKEVDCNVTF